MVAALCIIGVFIYFFFWTRRVNKEEIEAWSSIGEEEIREEITGRVIYCSYQRKRYYKDYWYFLIEGKLALEKEKENLPFLWKKPAKDGLSAPQISKNDIITLEGQRKNQIFYAHSIHFKEKEE